MKHLFLPMLLLTSFIFSSACAAEEEIEKRIVVVSSDEKKGLGVAIVDLDEEKKNELGVDKGALVVEVIEDSEAERIGLKKDDVITEFEGKKIKDAEELHKLVEGIAEKGKKVSFVIYRDKKSKTYSAEMKSFKPEKIHIDIHGDDFKNLDYAFSFDDDELKIFDSDNGPHKEMLIWNQNDKGGYLGVEGENISEQMLDFFEVKFGVLVETVLEKTPAEKAGLKAGDVIVRMNDRDIKDFDDLVRTLNYYNPGEKVTVYYVRKGKSKKVDVELAKKDHNVFKHHFPHGKGMFVKSFDVADSLKGIKKNMKIIKKKLKDIPKELKEIEIDIDIYII